VVIRSALPRLLCLCVLVGCSAVNAPGNHTPEPIDATDFCGVYADVVCDAIISCCETIDEAARDGCIAAAGVECTRTLGPLISDPRAGYDDVEAAVQLAVGQVIVNECGLSFSEWLVRRDGLASMFTGSLVEGEACDPIFTETATRFDSPRFVACGPDLACRANLGLTDWSCLPPVGLGSVCVLNCEIGLACVPDSAGLPVCVARLPAGQSCTTASQCESYNCACAVRGDPSTCTCRPANTVQQAYCGLLP